MTLLNHRDLFHVCHTVDDVEAAMAAFGDRFGLTWTPLNTESFVALMPGAEPTRQESTTTWSREGPVYIELGQIGAGALDVRSDLLSPHHCGYWCDDIAETRDGLIASGWKLEFEVAVRDNDWNVPFLRSPTGYGVELVARSGQAALEQRIAR